MRRLAQGFLTMHVILLLFMAGCAEDAWTGDVTGRWGWDESSETYIRFFPNGRFEAVRVRGSMFGAAEFGEIKQGGWKSDQKGGDRYLEVTLEQKGLPETIVSGYLVGNGILKFPLGDPDEGVFSVFRKHHH